MHKGRWSLAWALVLALAAAGLWSLAGHFQRPVPPPPPPKSTAATPPAPPVDPYADTHAALPLIPPTLDGTATVRARVLSLPSGEPLAGATIGIVPIREENSWAEVRAPTALATTNAAGAAVLPSAQPGIFSVCAWAPKHAQACEEDVGVVSGGTLAVELKLPPRETGTLLGTVIHQDGTPAAGVWMMAKGEYPIEDSMAPVAVTDAQGAFRLEGLTPGPYSVLPITSEGQAAPRSVDEVKAGQEARLDVVLAPFAPITVTPVWPKGGKIFSWEKISSVTVDSAPLTRQADGSYRGSTEAGVRQVYASDTAGQQAWRKVKLTPGKLQRVTLALARDRRLGPLLVGSLTPTREPFEVAGHVLLADGTPVKAMHVAMERPSHGPCGNVPRRFTHIRFEGSAFLLRPPIGEQTLYAWLEDGRAGKISVTGTAGQRVVANITLDETGAVTGQLSPRENSPFPTDIVIDDMWNGAWQFTERDGSFFVAGLKPGEHLLGNTLPARPFTIRARERTELGVIKRPAF